MFVDHSPSQALGEEPMVAGSATSPVGTAAGAGEPASGPAAWPPPGIPWNNSVDATLVF